MRAPIRQTNRPNVGRVKTLAWRIASTSGSATDHPPDSDVQPVHDQTKPREEAQEPSKRKAQSGGKPGCRQWKDAPPDRPAPRDELRVRIEREFGAGELEQAEMHRLHVS